MQTSDPLIRTKLRLPFTRPGLVSRYRLQKQIDAGLHGPLTLIIAPAGFGKTTLVAASVADCGMPVSWLSLDRDDNQPGRFTAYLIAAVTTANPQIGLDAARLINSIPPATSEAALTSLINDLDAASAELVLVLDDYQFISNPAVHAELAFFLDHRPRTLHLLVASRSDPALPLARLRARGQLVELRAADLRFTPTEAGLFLNDVMGLHLDADAVALLEERTEGWIAGLQMAALSMHDRKDVHGFIEAFSGTNRFILDYLLEEVLANQTRETQRFLLYTSILERLTAPLCDALLSDDESLDAGEKSGKIFGSPSSRELETLERENLFLVSLDDGSGGGSPATWFRYHHLFADLLKARLQQTQPDLIPQLHIRAAAWLEQKGYITGAIQHLLAAQELEKAAGLIERYGPARWAENDMSVMQMADNLPREMLVQRSVIGVYQAWLLINQGFIEKAYPLLIDLSQKFSSANSYSEQRWIQTVVHLALAFLTPSLRAQGFDSLPEISLMDEIPACEVIIRDAAEILYAMTLGRLGEYDRAAEFSRARLECRKGTIIITPQKATEIPNLVPFLATIYMFEGQINAASALCHEYLDPVNAKGIRISPASNLDVVLGAVEYEWNNLDEAERNLRDGLKMNEAWDNIMTDAFGMLALVHVLKAKGEYAQALQLVGRFETRLQGQSRPVEFSEGCRTLRICVQLASGDGSAAFEWADKVLSTEDYQRYPEYYHLTLARIRLAQGRYSQVEEILARVTVKDLAGNRLTRQIEIDLLLAAALAGQQRLPAALARIEDCLALAEPEGYIRVFVTVGKPARELLAAYLRSDRLPHKAFAQKVLNAFTPARNIEEPRSWQGGLVEPLSERELEVLRLMALGKTNQDIAGQLIVASGTIKAHAASIYRKLDVANRTEAVARARQLGILA